MGVSTESSDETCESDPSQDVHHCAAVRCKKVVAKNSSAQIFSLSATGGAAMGAALNFISDESSMRQLREKLPRDRADSYPYFDVLLQTEKGANTGRSVSVLISRSPVPMKLSSGSSSNS